MKKKGPTFIYHSGKRRKDGGAGGRATPPFPDGRRPPLMAGAVAPIAPGYEFRGWPPANTSSHLVCRHSTLLCWPIDHFKLHITAFKGVTTFDTLCDVV